MRRWLESLRHLPSDACKSSREEQLRKRTVIEVIELGQPLLHIAIPQLRREVRGRSRHKPSCQAPVWVTEQRSNDYEFSEPSPSGSANGESRADDG